MASTDKTLEEIHELTSWDSPPVHRDVEISLRSTIYDKAVGHVYGSDDSELPSLGSDLEQYGHWSSVVSTIYNRLYQLSQFDPSTVEYSAISFTNHRRLFSTCPFWNGQFGIAFNDAEIMPQNYLQAIDTIHALIRDIEIAHDIEHLMISNFKKIAELASKPSTLNEPSQKKSTFQNATIAITSGNVSVILLYAQVSMVMSPDKGRYQVDTQNIRIVRGYGILDFAFCKRHADAINGFSQTSITDWVDSAAANHEPENTSEGWPPDITR